MYTLKIKNLTATVEDKIIINDVSLTFHSGETHAIMGRNGSGKSSLIKLIIGHPAYTIESGTITLETPTENIDILDLSVDERANAGLFMNFQYPVEVPGLTNQSFLKTAYNAKLKAMDQSEVDVYDFNKILEQKAQELSYNLEFLSRGLNVGFSGGEKKRNEMLQLALLEPKFAFLDELDSGLDRDALALVLKQIQMLKKPESAFIFITHYANVITHIKPKFVHIMHEGKLLLSSEDAQIAQQIEQKGFDFIIPKES